MEFTPNTSVKICSAVPLDNTYKDTLTFGSASTQTAYFTGKAKYTFTDFTYQRIRQAVRVPMVAENLYDCNYLMFQNTNYGTKWFYAFITQINYIDHGTTELVFEIDAIQTWFFDMDVKPSFVIREHVNDDRVGVNLVPENLEHGEYMDQSIENISDNVNMAIVVSTTSTTDQNVTGEMYGGIYSGCKMYAWNASDADAVSTFLQNLDVEGKGGAVSSVFMAPAWTVPFNASTHEVTPSTVGRSVNKTFTPNFNNIDGYVPKNNKLYSYPYNFMSVTNYQGNSAVYRYEYFNQGPDLTSITFTMYASVGANPVIFLIPTDYKRQSINYDEMITMSNFPMCNWSYGSYNNWLAQNTGSLASSGIASVLSAVSSSRTGAGPVDIANTGFAYTAQTLGTVYDHWVTPPQARGNASGYANASVALSTFGVIKKCIHWGYASKLDAFFTRYGYRVNSMKVPNITGRPRWNYVQTADTCITGSVPTPYLVEIKSAFQRGLTFWHGDWVGDYSGDNSPTVS